MDHELNDFEIIEAALTGWDEPVPQEVPPALAALGRIKSELRFIADLHSHEKSVGELAMDLYEASSTARRLLNP